MKRNDKKNWRVEEWISITCVEKQSHRKSSSSSSLPTNHPLSLFPLLYWFPFSSFISPTSLALLLSFHLNESSRSSRILFLTLLLSSILQTYTHNSMKVSYSLLLGLLKTGEIILLFTKGKQRYTKMFRMPTFNRVLFGIKKISEICLFLPFSSRRKTKQASGYLSLSLVFVRRV